MTTVLDIVVADILRRGDMADWRSHLRACSPEQLMLSIYMVSKRGQSFENYAEIGWRIAIERGVVTPMK